MILHGECWGEGVRINDCENFHHRSQVVCHGVYLKKRDKIPVRKQIDCRCDLHLHLPCFLFTFCLSVKTGDLAIIQRITIIIAFLALQGALIVIIVCSSAQCADWPVPCIRNSPCSIRVYTKVYFALHSNATGAIFRGKSRI